MVLSGCAQFNQPLYLRDGIPSTFCRLRPSNGRRLRSVGRTALLVTSCKRVACLPRPGVLRPDALHDAAVALAALHRKPWLAHRLHPLSICAFTPIFTSWRSLGYKSDICGCLNPAALDEGLTSTYCLKSGRLLDCCLTRFDSSTALCLRSLYRSTRYGLTPRVSSVNLKSSSMTSTMRS